MIKQLFVPGLLALALVGPRVHGSTADDSLQPDRPPTKTEMKRYDADKDGKLSDDEVAHMKADEKARKEAREKKILAKYDVNKNGVLDPEEKAKWETDRKADHDRRVAQREARQAAHDAAAAQGDDAQK
jgi:hypothetical protein